jgi:hypothetical protein
MSRDTPTYSLDVIHAAIRLNRYLITRRAAEDAAGLLLDEDDIKECVLGLGAQDFYKTMPSRRIEGLWQDVYRCRYAGMPIYTKVQVSHDGQAVVISFKTDESA